MPRQGRGGARRGVARRGGPDMSGWTELRDLGVVVRPLDDPAPERGYQWSRFRAPWASTIEILARELRALDAERVVLGLAVEDRNIRLDGLPRADARLDDPRVILAFDSKYGPLRYATGEYDDWQDNVRAIALSMEALRAVDRYGVSKRGEQYRGWRQLTAGSTAVEDAITGRARALDALAEAIGVDRAAVEADVADAVRTALKATHPDRGGDETRFRVVMRAKEVLGV